MKNKQYRKKPVVVEAFRYGYDVVPYWFTHHRDTVAIRPDYAKLRTHNGEVRVNHGDYVVKAISGEIYPCNANLFHEIYEEV